ncbi:gluconate 2-dehydrogenase subunit 3 family protein [Paraburkholderia sp. BCC1886]|uniref:gluconate 2-dehydrogenase subunit 3 family protein n=1 Tax=Paraburkholderia sp. BCC1886 TaxID=2562670 RepID=UPI001181D134|nr:gluconate 2-dehydrogenase subunit 3 family protein [Paraburkholderia sp. BCC1886]
MTDSVQGRRRFIRHALGSGAALGVGVATPLVGRAATADAPAAGVSSASPERAGQSPGYLFLRPAEADFVEALVDHMVPADQLSPSGTGLAINIYFDRALGGNWGAGERLYTEGPWHVGTPSQGYQLPLTPAELFRASAEGIDRLSGSRYGTTFARLSPDDKEAFLHALESPDTVLDNGLPGPLVFGLLYQLVVEGMFADPIYGGNAGKAGWRLVGFPGVIATHAMDVVKFKNRRYVAPINSIADLD